VPFILYNFKNQTGSIVLIMALSLSLILTMFFIFVDTGYLYSKKNICQNAVEAAAMAGAASLCEDDPEAVAREIAAENGLPVGSLVVRVGFYDENDEYTDFPEYKDFVWEASDSYPEGEYNNAVMVILRTTEKTLMGGFAGRDEVTVGAAAVAYLKRYGMLSLGEDGDDGITFTSYWNINDGQPVITNGDIHANNDIVFVDTPPDIDAATVTVSAGGTISGYDGGISGADPISVKPVSAYLQDLYARADKIINEDDFPTSYGTTYTDEFGNTYDLMAPFSRISFHPRAGDHEGRIYYFESDGENVQLANPEGDEAEITNFTFVSGTGIRYYPSNTNFIWGGENEKQVILMAAEDIDVCGDSSNPGTYTSDSRLIARGLLVWAGGDILWRNAYWSYGDSTRYLRMVAGGSIIVVGPDMSFSVGYDMYFGPPCPPYHVRLGLLVTP
jgi:hypothetical protein